MLQLTTIIFNKTELIKNNSKQGVMKAITLKKKY